MTSQPEPSTLHLLLPGLFGPQSGPWPEPGMVHGLALPHLQKILSRSNRLNVAGDDFHSTLLALFGLPAEEAPIGALCRLGDGGKADDACWLRADPVYFRADRDRLLLFEGRFLDITRTEADEYAALFNQHFGDDGWRLEALKRDRWYLSAPDMPEVELPPLHDVSGRNIDPFLPRGADGGPFFQLMNEMQMLFHQANPTQQRSAKGITAVNGLWPWGAGRLGDIPYTQFRRVISDEPLSMGLAKLALIPSMPLDDETAPMGEEGAILWVEPELQQALLTDDGTLWRDAISTIDARLDQLLVKLQDREVETLFIYPCSGSCFKIDRAALRRFWRRNRSLTDWVVE
ncbi:MAG: hypothetical protein L3J28_10185 [Candidatus Polarisedimenticolaceae bacterium]|nr:hypothetical protein [Candidatus Polarisedimenticolaceae bacterium]